MLIREGAERDNNIDRRLACLLASIAGAVNAAAFHAAGFFSANMTGNVSALSFRLAQGDVRAICFLTGIIASFVTGSTFSALLINAGHRRRTHAIYAYSILAEALLLTLVMVVYRNLPLSDRAAYLILSLSFLMGLQNAVVTRISNARIRTTHVSGMLTDIGIELAVLIDFAWTHKSRTQAKLIWANFNLHTLTVLAFLAGGVAGIGLQHWFGFNMLFGIAALLLAVALHGIASAWKIQKVSQENHLKTEGHHDTTLD